MAFQSLSGKMTVAPLSPQMSPLAANLKTLGFVGALTALSEASRQRGVGSGTPGRGEEPKGGQSAVVASPGAGLDFAGEKSLRLHLGFLVSDALTQ